MKASKPADQEQLVDRRPHHEDIGGTMVTPERARYEEWVRQSPDVQRGANVHREDQGAAGEN